MFDKPMNNLIDKNSSEQVKQQLNGNGSLNIKNGSASMPVAEVDVHAMPKKFLPQGTKSSGGSWTKILMVIIGLLAVVSAAIAGVYWYMNNKQSNSANNNQPPVVNQVVNTNQSDNNINASINGNQNVNINANTNIDINANTNTNVNVNTNTNPDLSEVNTDADNDGLTYNEEIAFNTNPNNDDTDRDGYKDGAEVKNLYNPLLPRQSLLDSGLVTNFINDIFGYSLYRPTAWLAQALGEDLSTITILPDSDSGEFFTIVSRPNTNRLSLSQARAEVSDILDPDINMINYALAKQPALRSSDQNIVLMVTNDYVYVISHNLSTSATNGLATTFEMMLSSFKLLD